MKIIVFVLLIGLIYSACHYSCGSCNEDNNPQKCIGCPASSGRTLLIDGSVRTCPCDPGTFDDGPAVTCAVCSITCLTCTTLN